MALPAATDFTGSSITEAQFKTAMATLRSYLSGLLGDAGTVPAAQAALDVIFGSGVTAKSGAYILATTDRGQLFDCTGTWTLSLLAAATAGAGFCVALRNSGTGVITITPDGSETVDGESSITIEEASSAILVCTGTGWVTVGLAAPIEYPISIANGGTGATTAAAALAALGGLNRNMGYNNPGSYCFAAFNTPGDLVPGTVTSGEYLYCVSSNQAKYSYSLSGAWKACGFGVGKAEGLYYGTLWQRYA